MKTSWIKTEMEANKSSECVVTQGIIGRFVKYLEQYKKEIDLVSFLSLAWEFWKQNHDGNIEEMRNFCDHIGDLFESTQFISVEKFRKEAEKWNGKDKSKNRP
ncbi:MAG: hypothetical protein WC445_04730 [Patescibacteria group bacterium]